MWPDRALTEASGRRADDEFHSCSASDRRGLLVQGVRIQGGIAVPEAAVGRAPRTRWFGATLKNFDNRYQFFNVKRSRAYSFERELADLHVACIYFNRVSIFLQLAKYNTKWETHTMISARTIEYLGTLHDTNDDYDESVANLWEYAMCDTGQRRNNKSLRCVLWIFEVWVSKVRIKKKKSIRTFDRRCEYSEKMDAYKNGRHCKLVFNS